MKLIAGSTLANSFLYFQDNGADLVNYAGGSASMAAAAAAAAAAMSNAAKRKLDDVDLMKTDVKKVGPCIVPRVHIVGYM